MLRLGTRGVLLREGGEFAVGAWVLVAPAGVVVIACYVQPFLYFWCARASFVWSMRLRCRCGRRIRLLLESRATEIPVMLRTPVLEAKL